MHHRQPHDKRFDSHIHSARSLMAHTRERQPELDANGNPIISVGVGWAGFFRIEHWKRDPITGERQSIREYEFENLITNNGLDMLGADSGQPWGYCSVGTDNTPEAVGDTTLGTYVAHVVNQPPSNSTRGSEPYYGKVTLSYAFGEGAAAGNLQEIGIGPSTGGTNLWSRSLIYDGASPLGTTTITVLSDEYLTVYYELRLYPDHVGSPQGSGTLYVDNASPRATASYQIRAAYVTTHSYLGTEVGNPANANNVTFEYGEVYGPDSTLGAVTSEPTASQSIQLSSSGGTSISRSSYSSGTYYRDITFSVPLNEGNLSGSPIGFDCIRLNTTFGCYQIHVDHLWQKTSSDLFTFTIRLAWSRASL